MQIFSLSMTEGCQDIGITVFMLFLVVAELFMSRNIMLKEATFLKVRSYSWAVGMYPVFN
jgi:hypothetical protein